MSNYTPDQIAAYAAAIQSRLTELGRPKRWLAEQLGISAQAVQDRLTTPGHPARVYEVEDILEAPGRICYHLGYLRPGIDYEMIECPDAVELIMGDQRLSADERTILISLYRRLVGETAE